MLCCLSFTVILRAEVWFGHLLGCAFVRTFNKDVLSKASKAAFKTALWGKTEQTPTHLCRWEHPWWFTARDYVSGKMWIWLNLESVVEQYELGQSHWTSWGVGCLRISGGEMATPLRACFVTVRLREGQLHPSSMLPSRW